MAQDYHDLTEGTDLATFCHTRVAQMVGSVLTSWAGTTEPSATIRRKGLVWLDETAKRLKLRNIANGAWLPVGTIHAKVDERSAWSSTFSVYLPPLPQAVEIESIAIIVDTTTSGSDGSNNYAFNLTNLTQTEELFSADPTTAASVSGVGGGEITANTAYILTPNQNDVLAANDVLQFTVTVTGSPTTLTAASIFLNAYPAL